MRTKMYVRPLLLATVLLAVGVARLAEGRSRPVQAFYGESYGENGGDTESKFRSALSLFFRYLQKIGISIDGFCVPNTNVGPVDSQRLWSLKAPEAPRTSNRRGETQEHIYNLLRLPMTHDVHVCYANIVDSLELEGIEEPCQNLMQMLETENTPCQEQALAHALVLHDCVPPTPPARDCGVSVHLKERVRRKSPSAMSRIYGGMEAGSCDSVPWQVRLLAFGTMCGAVILDEYHVLTAAHCTASKEDFSRSLVETGDYKDRIKEQYQRRTPVLRVTPHEDFDKVTYSGPDIALVTLKKPLRFDNPCTVPACMDPSFVPDFKFCVVSGWGKTGNGTSRVLKMAEVRAFRGSNCDRKFSIDSSSHLTRPDSQICGGDHEGRAVFCGGDSGGPLVCLDTSTNTYVLAGIVSYNYECDSPNDPGVFTDVTAYSDWILNNM